MPNDLSKQARVHAEALMGCACSFILGTEEKPFSGGECSVFALSSETNVRLGIRIPHQFYRPRMEAEVQNLKVLKTAQIPNVAELLGYSYIPQPFIALGWADGTAMTWTDTSPEVESRNLILKNVAEINMDLLKTSTPSSMIVVLTLSPSTL